MRNIRSLFRSTSALRFWGLRESACSAILGTRFPWINFNWSFWPCQERFCWYWHSLLTTIFWLRGLWFFHLVLPLLFSFSSFRRRIASAAHQGRLLCSAKLPLNFCGLSQTVPTRSGALSLVRCTSLWLLSDPRFHWQQMMLLRRVSSCWTQVLLLRNSAFLFISQARCTFVMSLSSNFTLLIFLPFAHRFWADRTHAPHSRSFRTQIALPQPALTVPWRVVSAFRWCCSSAECRCFWWGWCCPWLCSAANTHTSARLPYSWQATAPASGQQWCLRQFWPFRSLSSWWTRSQKWVRLWFPLESCSSSPGCCITPVYKPDLDPSFAVPITALRVVWSFHSYHGSACPAPPLSLSSSLSTTWSCSHSSTAWPFSLFLTSAANFPSCTFISTSGNLSGILRLSRRTCAGCCLTKWGIMISGQRQGGYRSMSHILYWNICCLVILWKFWTLGSSALSPLASPQSLSWS